MCWQVERAFAPDTAAPGLARAMVGAELTARLISAADDAISDASLVASELVSNALGCGSETLVVSVRLCEDELTLQVTDSGAGWPQIQPVSAARARGRGLRIVDALTQRWGVTPLAGGKAVWAVFGPVHWRGARNYSGGVLRAPPG